MCCTQYSSKFGKLSSGQMTGKFFIPIPKKGSANECSIYHTTALISHVSKVMFKLLQARLQRYMNRELPDVQAGFRKGRGTRDQLTNIHWIIEKARDFQENIHFCFIYQSLWLYGSQKTVENSSRAGNTRPPYPPPQKSVCRSRSNSQNQTWSNELVPNRERSTSRLYCHPAYLTDMQSQSVSSVTQPCLTLCNPIDCSTPGLPVYHQLLEFTQTHVHRVGDAIQPSYPLLSPSPLSFNLSQHQGLFKCISSSYQVAKVLEFQLQHQSFQWIFMTDFP